MKKIILFMLGMFLIAGVVAEVQSLGTFKRGEEVELLQIAAGFTSCNITSVLYPNSSCAICSEVEMTKNGNQYNYSFNKTNELGKYIVNGYCTDGSEDAVWSYDFEITLTGLERFSMIIIMISLITVSYIILFYSKTTGKYAFEFFSGLLLTVIGLYNVAYGFEGIKNIVIQGFGVINIGIGFIAILEGSFKLSEKE